MVYQAIYIRDGDMSKVLVKFSAMYDDDFDVTGFKVFEKEVWDTQVREFGDASSYLDYNFGSNYGWSNYDHIGNAWVDDNYSVVPIYNEEASVLIKLFGEEYGVFPMPTDLIGNNDGSDE